MEATCQWIKLHSVVDISRDKNDDFLLALCKDASLTHLITGDKDLLVLESFENTQMLNFSDFIEIFEESL